MSKTREIISADIAEIASKLCGKVSFTSIAFDQILQVNRGENINDLWFIGYKFGLWFYTSRASLDMLCYNRKNDFPTLVICENSNNVYKIK